MSQSSWIGNKIGGRYRIEEMIGQGGMSAVYKATDPNLRRVVAVKMIHSHLSDDPGFVRRFEEEATAVAQLRHPNIIQVFDFNKDAETYYMVMEFVPGETLQSQLRRINANKRRMATKDICEYAAQVCDAVAYAHQRGMIHRDIKPANVMLSVTGQAILMDFGIAKIVGGQQHTATGAVIGTALYMSPEQIKGEHPDHRTDIYSLGVMLFEMVSGHPPFEADSAMTLMMMHINDPIPDLGQIKPEIPIELVAVVHKALQKNPAHRYQTASEMAAALRAVAVRLEAEQQAKALPTEATIVEQPDTEIDQPPIVKIERAEATFVEEPGHKTEQPVATAFDKPEPELVGATSFDKPEPAPMGATARESYREYPNNQAGGMADRVSTHPPTAREARPAVGQPKKKDLRPALFGGGALLFVGLICMLGGGFFFFNQFLGGSGDGNNTGLTADVQDTPVPIAVADNPEPTATFTPTATNTPVTPTLPPTTTPTITLTPTPTVPPGIPYVRINSISINDSNQYVVEYETFEYTETLPGMHVHFFFDTVKPENAGLPASGPWILYGGPRPFDGYKVSDRPVNAYQMCALVANANHSIQLGSGNCVDLP